MSEPITGRHRPVDERPGATPPPTVDAPPPELGPYAHIPPSPEPQAQPQATVRGWIVTALLVAAAVGAAWFAIATNEPLSPAPAPTSTTPTGTDPQASTATTAAPQATPLLVTALVAQTCGRLGIEPTADGVWDAAAALEVGPNALTPDEAWALVDLAARLDCPQYAELVDATIASAGG